MCARIDWGAWRADRLQVGGAGGSESQRAARPRAGMCMRPDLLVGAWCSERHTVPPNNTRPSRSESSVAKIAIWREEGPGAAHAGQVSGVGHRASSLGGQSGPSRWSGAAETLTPQSIGRQWVTTHHHDHTPVGLHPVLLPVAPLRRGIISPRGHQQRRSSHRGHNHAGAGGGSRLTLHATLRARPSPRADWGPRAAEPYV